MHAKFAHIAGGAKMLTPFSRQPLSFQLTRRLLGRSGLLSPLRTAVQGPAAPGPWPWPSAPSDFRDHSSLCLSEAPTTAQYIAVFARNLTRVSRLISWPNLTLFVCPHVVCLMMPHSPSRVSVIGGHICSPRGQDGLCELSVLSYHQRGAWHARKNSEIISWLNSWLLVYPWFGGQPFLDQP